MALQHTRRSGAQSGNGRFGFLAGINQFFAQCTDNAIAAGIDFADLIAMCSGGLDYAAGAGINNGGNTTGLCVKRVFFRHLEVFREPESDL